MPKLGEFTFADIIRHLIAFEKMFIRVLLEEGWNYEGHTSEEESLDSLITLLDATHVKALEILK